MKRKTILLIIIPIVIILIALRVVLPIMLTNYSEKKINSIDNITGKIGNIDLRLFEGLYTIKNLSIRQQYKKIDTSFVFIDRIDLSIDRGAIFKGILVANVTINKSSTTFITGITDSITKATKPFAQTLQELIPFKIDRLRITQGELLILNSKVKSGYEIHLKNIDANLQNLTNSTKASKSLYATMEAHGVAMESGTFTLNIIFNPVRKVPTFDLDATLSGLNLTEINSIISTYSPITFEGGKFDAKTHLKTEGKQIVGYIEPTFDSLQFFSDEEKNILEKFWGGITELFDKGSEKKLTTKLYINTTMDEKDIDLPATIINALANAFKRALIPGKE